jgi:hypothetical protein
LTQFDKVADEKKPNAVAGFKSLSRTIPKGGMVWSLRKQASEFYAEVFGLFSLIVLAFVIRASWSRRLIGLGNVLGCLCGVVTGILRVLVGCFVVAGAVHLRSSQMARCSVLQMLTCFLVVLLHGLRFVLVICGVFGCVQCHKMLSVLSLVESLV